MPFSVILSLLSLLISVYLFFFIPLENEKFISQSLINEVAKIDNGSLLKIRENNKLSDKLLLEAEQELNSLISTKNNINAIIDKNSSLLLIDDGEVVISNKNIPKLSNPEGCEANRGLINQVINFKKSFNTPPKVMMALSTIDFRDGTDHRITLKINNITKENFTINFNTWCDTSISNAKANWIAIGY